MYPNPSSANDLLLGVSFLGERREGKKSYIILSVGAKTITHIPWLIIIITPFLIIAGNFPGGIFLQVVAEMPTSRSNI